MKTTTRGNGAWLFVKKKQNELPFKQQHLSIQRRIKQNKLIKKVI
jgi:hypothetical protein